MDVLPYADAERQLSGLHRYLMLGNGFSIALRPDIFTYGSLYDNADFSAAPAVPALRPIYSAGRRAVNQIPFAHAGG